MHARGGWDFLPAVKGVALATDYETVSEYLDCHSCGRRSDGSARKLAVVQSEVRTIARVEVFNRI